MSYAQFVDAISASPTVRLDIDDGVTWSLQASGTEIGAPPVNRAVVSSLLADGVRIPAAAYGPRTLQLTCKIFADPDDAATQVQRLAWELDRPVNFLRWQPDTTHPVFFRLLRGELADLRFDPALKQATFAVLAEPFALGLPETLSPVAVNRDPAAGSNPTYFDVTGVPGDVPAATKINVRNAFFNIPGTLAIRRKGTPSNVPYLKQAESLTQGTDTTTQPNDAAMSGIENNFSRCTFATATMTTRISGSVPDTASVDARGTYRVFVRVRRSSATGVINLRLRVGPEGAGSVTTTISTVATELTTSVRYVDMGLVQIPYGIDPVYDGPSGIELQVSASAVLFAVQAERISGTSTLDLDLVLFVPADDQLMVIDVGNDSNGHVVFDSYSDMGYADDTTGKVDSSADIVPLGSMLELAPNVTNRVYMRVGHLISGTNTVDITYWPKYLHVRPVST